MDIKTTWNQIAEQLKKEMSSLAYHTWIEPLSVHYINEEDRVILLSWNDDKTLVKHVNDNYKNCVEATASEILNDTYKVVIKPRYEYLEIELESSESDYDEYVNEFTNAISQASNRNNNKYSAVVFTDMQTKTPINGAIAFEGTPMTDEICMLHLKCLEDNNKVYYSTINMMQILGWELKHIVPINISADGRISNKYIFSACNN